MAYPTDYRLDVVLMRLIGKQCPELAAAMSEHPQYVKIVEYWLMDPEIFTNPAVKKFAVSTGIPGCESRWLLLAHVGTLTLFCWKEA